MLPGPSSKTRGSENDDRRPGSEHPTKPENRGPEEDAKEDGEDWFDKWLEDPENRKVLRERLESEAYLASGICGTLCGFLRLALVVGLITLTVWGIVLLVRFGPPTKWLPASTLSPTPTLSPTATSRASINTPIATRNAPERVPTATSIAPNKPVPLPTVAPKPVSKSEASGPAVVGRWVDGLLLTRIEIYAEDGRFRLKVTWEDGSVDSQSLTEVATSGGRRFNTTDGSGDYYIIGLRGDLEIWTPYGLFSKATKR